MVAVKTSRKVVLPFKGIEGILGQVVLAYSECPCGCGGHVVVIKDTGVVVPVLTLAVKIREEMQTVDLVERIMALPEEKRLEVRQEGWSLEDYIYVSLAHASFTRSQKPFWRVVNFFWRIGRRMGIIRS
jgi:hypothetical protein